MLVFRLQRRQPLAAVFRVAPDKFQASFLRRQRRRAHVNAEHVAEPSVLADALVHHLLVDASSARVALARTRGKLLVAELAPHADHLDSLAGVGFDEEAVFHREMPVKMWNLLSGKVAASRSLKYFPASARTSPRFCPNVGPRNEKRPSAEPRPTLHSFVCTAL